MFVSKQYPTVQILTIQYFFLNTPLLFIYFFFFSQKDSTCLNITLGVKQFQAKLSMLLTSVFHPMQNSSQKTVILIDPSIVFEMMRKNIFCLKVNKPVLASAAHKW